ncbi:MAG: recombination regulator RecX [bacterium]|nr:recombination regulator RecX [bacterium]
MSERKDKLLKTLAKQDLTIWQAKKKLSDWGFGQSEIQELIKECVQKNWLNDFRYAKRFIERKLAKGYGRNRIELELRTRGIPEDLCKSAFREVQAEQEQSEEVTLQNVAENEWKKLDHLPMEKRVNRLIGRLLRRGFLHHQVMNIVRSLEQREKRNYVGRNEQEEG